LEEEAKMTNGSARIRGYNADQFGDSARARGSEEEDNEDKNDNPHASRF
jgi:hypothetical protein